MRTTPTTNLLTALIIVLGVAMAWPAGLHAQTAGQ
jgi:hypothetical protein